MPSLRVVIPLILLVACGDSKPRCGTGVEDPETGLCTCPDVEEHGSSCELPRDAFVVEGHRGAFASRPPGNTMPSFLEAIRVGADVLEGDLRLTADEEVVFNHDPTLSPECVFAWAGSEPSRVVAELTLYELAGFDCHPELPGIQSPPQLEEVLDLRVRANVGFDLEFKEMGPLEAEITMRALVAYDSRCNGCLDGRLQIQSFDLEVLRGARGDLGDEVDASYSYLSLTPDEDLAAIAAIADVYAPYSLLVTAALVDEAHAAGLRVLPWTVNDANQMCRLIGFGVDGIISDDPALLARTYAECR